MITLPSGRKIGDGEPCFIIAEVGSNWQSLDDCLHSIREAKACGADAVKFQLYSARALYGFSTFSDCGELPPEWLPKLKSEADRVGIEFMCSAFSPELIDAVDPYVNIHKVASAECTHKRMLERLREIGKPVVLSTGAHKDGDISLALSTLGDTATAVLYCVAAYPAKVIQMAKIPLLRERFKRVVGYSDHSTDALVVPKAAALAGASIIEKHVTFIEEETPDSPHSLVGREFRAMVSYLRDIRDDWAPTDQEKPMILRHNRRLIATRDIRAGDYLIEDRPMPIDGAFCPNFGIYRSLKDDTHAFHPFMVDEVHGKIAKRDIKAGDGIGPGDI